MWCPPSEEECCKKWLSYSYISVLPGLCLPSGQLSVLFFHTWPILGPSPGVHAPLSQDGTQSAGFWDEQDSWPGILTWLLTHKESFCTCIASPLLQKSREWDPLILYSKRALLLFVLAMTSTVWCLQETDTGYLLYFCCYFPFGGWTGGWLQMPQLEPTSLLSQEMQTGGWLSVSNLEPIYLLCQCYHIPDSTNWQMPETDNSIFNSRAAFKPAKVLCLWKGFYLWPQFYAPQMLNFTWLRQSGHWLYPSNLLLMKGLEVEIPVLSRGKFKGITTFLFHSRRSIYIIRCVSDSEYHWLTF